MERISAACAMEWSIELEMALRSKRPGQAVKAIQQMGARLQQWCREPRPTMASLNIFGLVMGEDRLFANTILLRLADAFRLGDKDIRLSVVRVFLSEFKNHGKENNGKRCKRILSKDVIYNHMELLKRVKIVFDNGDVESRALALVLFGCWADFAKDSSHIRYLILSSLVSSEILEVKASLFAASCFCELAADFASVMLGMLLNVILSPDSSLIIKLAGVRVFAKMGSSYSVANRAYKIGLKLVLDSSEEDFLVSMLISLSKIATKSILLLSEQVDLLFSFLNPGRTCHLQAMALRCLHFIFVKGVCCSLVNSHLIKTLLRIVDDMELPSAMQYEALQILRKMIVYGLPDLSSDNMLEYTKLLNIIEKAAHSPIMQKSLLAIHVLVDASKNVRGRIQIGPDGGCFHSLPTRIISVIVDQAIILVKPLLEVCQNNSKAFQEFQSLLNLLLCLVGEHPDLGVLVLNKVRSFIEYLVDNLDSFVATRQASASIDEFVDFRAQNSINISLILVYVHRFSAICIENLNEVSTITNELLNEVQCLVEFVQCCRLFDHYIHLIYSILLHSHIIWDCVLNKNEDPSSVGRNLTKPTCNHLVAYEIFSLEHAEKMMMQRDNWPAYKAGMFAAYQGAWVTAAFIFAQLIVKTQSNSCSYWLKGLSQFAQSELKIQLFLLPDLKSSLVDWTRMKEFCTILFAGNLDEIGQGTAGNISKTDYTKVLVGAYHGLCSSEEILKSVSVLGGSCCFQRWFLALRAKVLKNVSDALELLSTNPLIKGNISNNEQVEKCVTVDLLNSLRQSTQISNQLQRLAQEYDLIAMSFIDMDSRSSKIISALALSCSLLAFTTGFVLFISNLTDHGILTCSQECSRSYLKGMLIQNLVGKLWFIDQETCSKLFLLSGFYGQAEDCFHLQPRNQILNSGDKARDILSVCKYAVSGILGLQNETKGIPVEEILCHITHCGFQIVLKTITKWMNIPFRIPNYFFKLRPCFGSELFAFSTDTTIPNELTLLQGFHLSLNLCLQLKNMPPDLGVRITKLYCILCSNASVQELKSNEETSGGMQLDYQSWEISDMIAMNKKLLHYATDLEKKTDNGKRRRDYDSDSDDVNVYGFMSFNVNDRGQGFANCLLDVSDYPLGSYRIKWHSCFIDNQGSYWSLLPLNAGPVFTVQKSPVED